MIPSSVIVVLSLVGVVACGEVSTPSDPVTEPDDREPRPPARDSGVSVPSRPDAGEPDPEDAGAEPGPPPSTGVPAGCPEPTPIAAEGQVIGIQSVHFGRSEVVLRNVSQRTQTIQGGDQGWQWCNIPGYFNVVLDERDIVLAPGETYTFSLIERGGLPRPLYNGEASEDTNELGIFTLPGSFNNPELVEAFVSWGEGSAFETRESTASMGLKWSFGSRVEIQSGHAGFVATGDATSGDGFTSVPGRCLPSR
jgi:hypothetical protein